MKRLAFALTFLLSFPSLGGDRDQEEQPKQQINRTLSQLLTPPVAMPLPFAITFVITATLVMVVTVLCPTVAVAPFGITKLE